MIGLSLFLVSLNAPSAKVNAAPYTNGHILDDVLFLNANSMNADNIQGFLASKSGTLDTSSFLMDCDVAGATSKQMYLSIGAPCGQTISAARIIYYSSQIYGVNPQVILATLQKEQSLITDPNPSAWSYNQAMGYGCPDSGTCNSNSSFFYQIDNGAWVLRFHYERANGNNSWWTNSGWVCGSTKNYYSPNLYPRQNVSFFDDNKVLISVDYVQNPATSAFYCYTPHPYNNPQGLYNLPAHGTTGMYYTGSYNFKYYYALWFGSTYAYTYNGIGYTSVFNPAYYLDNNSDLKSAFGNDHGLAFHHFVTKGMTEGRQAISDFNVASYKNLYPDLRWAFGSNLPAYYRHFSTSGRVEGRIAPNNATLRPATVYGGVDYSRLYDYNSYLSNNLDVGSTFNNDDIGTLWHFATKGINEGRQANANFNVTSYRARYHDLRIAYGNDLRQYYLHYLRSGQAEGRIATGNYLGGTSVLNGVDYTAIYDFDHYSKNNVDVSQAYGLNDQGAIQHFVGSGMNEGRRGNSEFNVYSYKSANSDLQNAYGNNLRLYYLHFLNYGKKEGRSGI